MKLPKNMTRIIFMLLIGLSISSCDQKKKMKAVNPINMEIRAINFKLNDSLKSGSSYLSVYSQIYSRSEHRTQDLTATVSMRNTNIADTIYIFKAAYFDTNGNEIRNYIKKPIFIGPMETVEIVIDEIDKEGGTGANFLFKWKIAENANVPFFEAVMISTSGQQGLSFTTEGRTIN